MVAVAGPSPPAWQARAVSTLAAAPDVTLAGVRVVDAEPPPQGAWALHRRLEQRIFGLRRDPLSPAPIPSTAGAAGAHADVLLWLPAAPPPAEHDWHADAVVWLAHGEAGEPAAAFRRALAAGEPVVASEARARRHGADAAIVIERTVSAARPFSLWLSVDLALWKLSDLAARAASRAAHGAPGSPAPSREPDPGAAPAGRFLSRSAGRWARAVVTRALFRRPWSIIVRERGAGRWEDGAALVDWAPGHVYADPVLFERDGRHHLFCEEIPAGQTRGVISHVELGSGARPAVVLEADDHLSYPFVFARGDAVYMIPETSARGGVHLYRATDFPLRWAHDATLVEDVHAVDATLVDHDGRLWLLAAIAPPGGSDLDELHVFSADDLHGPWRAHPANPVVSDVRCARPAGPVLRCADGRLVRPAQDGSLRYGGAISFRAIERLTADEYAEHEVGRLEAAMLPRARATHAYTRDSRFEAVDVRRREWRARRRP